jgi:hypothetical protein
VTIRYMTISAGAGLKDDVTRNLRVQSRHR